MPLSKKPSPQEAAELSRMAALFIKHLDVANISEPAQVKRLQRFADNQPYGMVVQVFGEMHTAFISKSFFGLVAPGVRQPADPERTLLLALEHGTNSQALGNYILHFMLRPHTDLFTFSSFGSIDLPVEINLIACSRALSFRGKNPHVILTLFGSAELFAASGAEDTALAGLQLGRVMSLSPREHAVYIYIDDPLTNEDIGIIIKRSKEAVRSQKRAIKKKMLGMFTAETLRR